MPWCFSLFCYYLFMIFVVMKSKTKTSKASFQVTMMARSFATEIRIINHVLPHSLQHLSQLTDTGTKHNLRAKGKYEVRLMCIQWKCFIKVNPGSVSIGCFSTFFRYSFERHCFCKCVSWNPVIVLFCFNVTEWDIIMHEFFQNHCRFYN